MACDIILLVFYTYILPASNSRQVADPANYIAACVYYFIVVYIFQILFKDRGFRC